MSKVLFLLKRREDYNSYVHNKIGITTGLYNSANFMNSMLNDIGIDSSLEVIIDNNCIDREVTKHRPKYCIIEAVWVIPSKFHILQKLHPDVNWIIRIHSEMPFMANEGMSMGWFGDYITYDNIYLAPNSPRMLEEVRTFIRAKTHWKEKKIRDKVVYLPNYYPQEYLPFKGIDYDSEYLNIGCFGAIRPLKNHLIQAIAAIEFAEKENKKLRFHVNIGRIEMKGEPVFHNLRGLFEHVYTRGHNLICHKWAVRDEFLNICRSMDIGMQVSFSETFNIVGADFVSQGIPLVSSCEIPWASSLYSADPVDSKSIFNMLDRTYNSPKLNVKLNKFYLKQYSNKTKNIWEEYFSKE